MIRFVGPVVLAVAMIGFAPDAGHRRGGPRRGHGGRRGLFEHSHDCRPDWGNPWVPYARPRAGERGPDGPRRTGRPEIPAPARPGGRIAFAIGDLHLGSSFV